MWHPPKTKKNSQFSFLKSQSHLRQMMLGRKGSVWGRLALIHFPNVVAASLLGIPKNQKSNETPGIGKPRPFMSLLGCF